MTDKWELIVAVLPETPLQSMTETIFKNHTNHTKLKAGQNVISHICTGMYTGTYLCIEILLIKYLVLKLLLSKKLITKNLYHNLSPG